MCTHGHALRCMLFARCTCHTFCVCVHLFVLTCRTHAHTRANAPRRKLRRLVLNRLRPSWSTVPPTPQIRPMMRQFSMQACIQYKRFMGVSAWAQAAPLMQGLGGSGDVARRTARGSQSGHVARGQRTHARFHAHPFYTRAARSTCVWHACAHLSVRRNHGLGGGGRGLRAAHTRTLANPFYTQAAQSTRALTSVSAGTTGFVVGGGAPGACGGGKGGSGDEDGGDDGGMMVAMLVVMMGCTRTWVMARAAAPTAGPRAPIHLRWWLHQQRPQQRLAQAHRGLHQVDVLHVQTGRRRRRGVVHARRQRACHVRCVLGVCSQGARGAQHQAQP